MISRRHFVQLITLAAASPASSLARSSESGRADFGPLKPDPNGALDLPAGFSYTVVAKRGQEMDDGLLVPGLQDGMAAFAGEDGQIILVCNHETHPYEVAESAFGRRAERFDLVNKDKAYDKGAGKSPALGGTTTIHYDPLARRRTHMHMSLLGTENNCAGGPTPWGSWLTCEECFFDPGTSFERGYVVHREAKHGYIFEVPARAMEAVDPVPLTHMGRFEHEAAAVNPASGVVYLTEDRHQSLLYRFLPNVPGKLQEGGRLQALAIKGQDAFDTRNWIEPKGMVADRSYEASWIDLEEPDVPENDLRLRGADRGAAIFARGEGICYAEGEIYMAATIGGPQRLGQIFAYTPSRAEGTKVEDEQLGSIRLLAESTTDSVVRHADNLTMSPWGDLIACEDTVNHCGLVGVTPNGEQYALADNPYTSSELAGICFSPDGNVMFANIQERGMTLAITGPWAT
jgi:secreted PhoX family phosphatase